MDEIEKVKSVLVGPLRAAGYELAEVSLSREKDGVYLRIRVDHDDPISLDDIVKVSDLINPILDQEDPLDSPYTLDVSSLGAEKPIALERLGHYLGRYVALHLSHPYKGENSLEGEIVSLKDGLLTLRVRDKSKKKDISFPVSTVDRARLAIRF